MIIHDQTKTAGLPCTVQAPPSGAGTAPALAAEHHMEVLLNARPAMRLVCTPEHLDELVLGRLFTEGLIESAEEVLGLRICAKGLQAEVLLQEAASARLREQETEAVPSCCTDNKLLLTRARGTPKKLSPIPWREDQIRALAAHVLQEAPLYRVTQAVHSCALAAGDELLCLREDLGRHNALDKAVGFALLQGLDLSRCTLFTTGRLPTDMVSKAIRAGIPLVVSKTYPTGEAMAMAREAGLTLVTLRGDGALTVWTEG